jgi:hypothetical protein
MSRRIELALVAASVLALAALVMLAKHHWHLL